MASANLTL